MLKTTLTIYCKPRNSGTCCLWSGEHNLRPNPENPENSALCLIFSKILPYWAKSKQIAHPCYTYLYITPDAPWFVILSSQTWNPTPHCAKGVNHLFSAPGNVIRCCSTAVMLWMKGRIQQCFCTDTDSSGLLTPQKALLMEGDLPWFSTPSLHTDPA